MKFNVSILKLIDHEADFVNFNGDEEFDFLDIAKINSNPLIDNNVLYFCVYDNEPELEGWYNEVFDRGKEIKNKIETYKNWSYVIDHGTLKEIENNSVKLIVVNDIIGFAKSIFHYVLTQVDPQIVAITGSVGKTTATALLEDVISTKYSSLRVYTKRITPLTLFSYIVNCLEYFHEVVVLEMSLYRKHHVFELAKLITPNIAVLLNIKNMHIGVKTINSLKDIFEGKIQIIQPNTKAVINKADDYLLTINYNVAITYSANVNINADIMLISSQYNKVLVSVFDRIIELTLYIPTRLFIEQSLVALAVCQLMKIDLKMAVEKISNFSPKENRIRKIIIVNKPVYLDADVTHSARLLEMSDNYSNNSYLIIHHVDFNLENPQYLCEDFYRCFKRFTKVIINDKEWNRKKLSAITMPENVIWKKKEKMLEHIEDNSFIVYHYSMFFKKNHSIEEIQNLE
ncbi:MAG: hypothetical protein IPK91_06220 [Saprospiraceae bacterium]|nr:hypothetical protein [Saprospiraceae bacterium]